ncbi:serpin family protein [Saccharibacillus sp. JS10]|uniref:serpin family protein n=1 Tax=Saccharibacillus sp. JS10 TaxID=2950552 RepID=UPI00210DA28B|nr:serpin family protein [Saccharibacillus sp. JS10]MCQ4085928.1 serpin family protein [Saccharibacillus sp. JS10]
MAQWTKKIIGITLIAVLAGCSNGSSVSPSSSPPKYTSVYKAEDANPKLSVAMNQFALNLYSKLEEHPGEDDRGPNRMISPAGIAIALSMLKDGTEGNTERQMDKMLRLNGMDPEVLAESQMILSDLLRGSDPAVDMRIANSLWSAEGTEMNPDFISRMEKSYEAQIQAIDFTSGQAAGKINQWASGHTAGKIQEVIRNPIDPNLVLLLMNAMYFKGDWTEPFEKDQTKDLPFTTQDGQEVVVPTMRQSSDYGYLEHDDFQAVRLPYGESKNFGMTLILPHENSSLSTFKKQQLPKFNRWSQELSQREGSIELPKFQLADDLVLNDALAALGMVDAFSSEKAELGGLFVEDIKPGAVYIDFVKHNTFIEVNEQGTEAAAVTVIGAVGTSAPVEQIPFEMKLDRPFFFVITDRTTDSIVFMGEVGNPVEH